MLTIYTRISTQRTYIKALLWKGTPRTASFKLVMTPSKTISAALWRLMFWMNDGHCVGVWNEYDGFRRHHPITECRWALTVNGFMTLKDADDLETLNDFA